MAAIPMAKARGLRDRGFGHDRHLMAARLYRDLWARSSYPLQVVGLLFLAGHNLTELGALRRSLAVDRLVFGQPRQDDLIEFLLRQVREERLAELVGRLLIDLAP